MTARDAATEMAFAKAAELLGKPLELPLGAGEPPTGEDFRRLATEHTLGDSWSRTGLDRRSRALVSVTIAATLSTREPLRGRRLASMLDIGHVARAHATRS